MTQARINTGKRGEQLAVDYLKSKGYKVLERNYRNCFGEVDIIAQDQQAITFIEIKTRIANKIMLGPPQIAVTRKKQQNIIKTSMVYIKKKNIFNRQIRYDVVAITLPSDRKLIEKDFYLIKNAFQTSF